MKALSLVPALLLVLYLPSAAQNLILDVQTGRFKAGSQSSSSFAHDLDRVRENTEIKNPFTYRQQAPRKSRLFLDLETRVVEQILNDQSDYLELRIPVDTFQSIELELVRKEILAASFNVTTASGEVNLPKGGYLFYHGSVKGHQDNWASVSIIDGEMTVFINDAQGSYNVTKLKDSDQYVFFSETELSIPNKFNCQASLPTNLHVHHEHSDNKSRNMSATCPVPIYVEVDHNSYKHMGSNVNQTSNFALNLFNQVIALYGADPVNIPLVISAVKIWDVRDPYGAIDSPSFDRLISFADAIQNDYPGRIAHLLSIGQGSEVGSAVNGGGVLCNSWSAEGAPIIGPTSAWSASGWSNVLNTFEDYRIYSPSVLVVSHELGHNFGSPHTFNCSWGPNGDQAIDNCNNKDADPDCTVQNRHHDGHLGTLMGYCTASNSGSNPRMEFHPQVLARIRNHYESSVATCNHLLCTGECTSTSAIPLEVGKAYEGSTLGGTNNTSTYACDEGSDAFGPEIFHRIVIEESRRHVLIFQGLVSEDAELTAYLLEDDCLSSLCFGKVDINSLQAIDYIAGTYYIAIDGQNGDAGAYRLRILEECSKQPPTSGSIEEAIYLQNDEIISGGQVATDANVRFGSHTAISLQPNFEVPKRSQFTAQLRECYQPGQRNLLANLGTDWNAIDAEFILLEKTTANHHQLRYGLASAGILTIEIYDNQGVIIAQPIEANMTQPGFYSIQLAKHLNTYPMVSIVMKLDGAIIKEERFAP